MGWFGLLLLVVAEACSSSNAATPIPEPPALDPNKIAVPVGVFSNEELVTIRGERGATAPLATIRLTNLDSTAEPVEVRADRSGWFEVTLEIPEQRELRLQALRGDQRSQPVDFIHEQNVLTPSPRHACFRVESGLDVSFDAVENAEILLENTCSTDATVDAAGTRLGLTDFALETALPLLVAPGKRAVVRVSHEAKSSEAREDVLFLNVGVDGVSHRYPVTLFAPAP